VMCRGRERFPAVPRSPFRRSENNATLLLAWKCASLGPDLMTSSGFDMLHSLPHSVPGAIL
jgi:hypothetical protein